MPKELSLRRVLRKDPDELTWVEVPINPVVDETKNLAGAESFAAIANIAATWLVSLLTANPLFLVLAGPVAEKIGFPLWELAKAIRRHRKSPDVPLRALVRDGITSCLKTLREDVLWHDTSYILIMGVLISTSNIEPALASAVAFVAAIPVASLLETLAQEIAHRGVRFLTTRRGFVWEDYYETRFLMKDGKEARRIFTAVRKRFELDNKNLSEYHDRYYARTMPTFGGRFGLVRERKVTHIFGPYHSFHNLEHSYTLVHKETRPDSEFNLFYLHKEKGRYDLSKRPLPRGKPKKDIRFSREIAHDDDIRIAHDQLFWDGKKTLSIIELKAYTESETFFSAMRYILRHSSAITCTYSKSQLVEMWGASDIF